MRLLVAISCLLLAVPMALPAQAGHSAPRGAVPDNGAMRVLTVATGSGAAHERITLGLDKAAIVQLDTDARDVLVSNPEIVSAVVRGPRRIFLLAQKVGQTNAFFFDAGGKQLLSIDIRVERDVTDLVNLLHAELPHSSVRVSALNDNVVLSGSVDNASDSTRAQDLAARFAGDAKKVVNMLRIGGGDQVMLKVHIAEVQRQIAKQLGIDLAGAAVVGGTPLALSTANPYGLMGQALSDLSGLQAGQVCAPGSAAVNPISALGGGGVCNLKNNVQGQLKALESVGLIRTLAEPNLTAVSGETATFLAGGEFPIPAARDNQGNITIEFKKFGVGLSFTPVVLSPNRISLQISTEVSELTNTGAFTLLGGTSVTSTGQTVTVPTETIPALAVRRAQTTVDLPSGGSYAIAGLLQHTTKQQIDAFPGLKDMPVLGALFRSRDFQNNETELVITVTPYLVSPVAPGKLAYPTDGLKTATDSQTIFMGKLNDPQKPAAAPASQADGRFIVE